MVCEAATAQQRVPKQLCGDVKDKHGVVGAEDRRWRRDGTDALPTWAIARARRACRANALLRMARLRARHAQHYINDASTALKRALSFARPLYLSLPHPTPPTCLTPTRRPRSTRL